MAFLIIFSYPMLPLHNQNASAAPADGKWLTYKLDEFSPSTINQLFTLNGRAQVPAGANFIRLTPTATEQSGAVFNNKEICPVNNYSFSTAFSFEMRNPSPAGASDGLTFTIQTGTTSQDAVGGGLGFYGIKPSFTVKYDTFQNPGYDPSANYVGLAENGPLENKDGWYTDLDEFNRDHGTNFKLSDGNRYYTWIDYDGLTQKVQVRLGILPDRESSSLILDVDGIDLGTIFDGGTYHAGFTASTGYPNYENHDIHSWYFINDYAPIETLDPQNDYKQAPSSLELTTEAADEQGEHQVTVTLLDPLGNPVSGASLEALTATSGNLTGPNGESVTELLSDANGKIHAVLKNADRSQDITISAKTGCATASDTIPASNEPPIGSVVVAEKSVSPEGEVFVGDELTYEVKVKNEGGDIAADAVFEDVIPAGTEYIPGTMKIVSGASAVNLTDENDQDAGYFDGNKVIIRLGDLPNTANLPDGIILQFKVKALASHVGEPVANKAIVSYKNLLIGEDATAESNEVTTPVEYRVPQLEAEKKAALLEKAEGNTDDEHPEAGDTILYTIQARNTAAGSLIENLVISDVIPEGLEYVPGTLNVDGTPVSDAQDGDKGHYADGQVFAQFGDVTDTVWHTVTFQAKVLAGQAGKDIRNVAVISGDNVGTPSTPEEVVEVYPRAVALESNKSATLHAKADGNTDADHPEVGDTLLYTIQTRNTVSDSLVANLTITDVIPEGLEYVPGTLTVDGTSASDAQDGDKGHFADGQVFAQFGDVTDTAWHTVTFQAKVLPGQAGKDIRNVAVVSGDNVGTPSTPEEVVEVYPRSVALESNKSASLHAKAGGNTDADHPEVGDTLLYTIQTRNKISDSLATNLTITDVIPEGLEYVPGTLTVDGTSVSDAQDGDKGHYADGQVFAQFGDVTDTVWHTVTFQAKVLAGQAGKDIRNVAVVSGDNVGTPSEPEEVVEVYPRAVALESNKSASLHAKAGGNTDADHPEVGDTLLYTIQTRNTVSDSLVTNLTITDVIPEGLEYVPGTLTVDGTSASDAQDGDQGYYLAGQVFGQFGDVTDTSWHTLEFKAIIKSGQAGRDIHNVALVRADNIGTPSRPISKVKVYPRHPFIETEKTAANLESGKSTFEVGDTVAYTIRARTVVSDTYIANLTITDTIPEGLEYVPGSLKVDGVSVTDDEGDDRGHHVTGVVYGGYGDIWDMDWHTLEFHAVIQSGQAGQTIKNTGTVTGDNIGEPGRPAEVIVVEEDGTVVTPPPVVTPPDEVTPPSGGTPPVTVPPVTPPAPVIESRKTSRDMDGGSIEVGDTIEYTIMARNTVSGSRVSNMVIADELPAGLAYMPGTLKVDGHPVTDEADGDNGYYATGRVVGEIGDVTDTNWHTIVFQVRVEPGQAGHKIKNVGEVSADNVSVPGEPYEEIVVAGETDNENEQPGQPGESGETETAQTAPTDPTSEQPWESTSIGKGTERSIKDNGLHYLPKTATNMYTYLLAGGMLLIAGMWLIRRKKTDKKNAS
ncbi:isopeptide-forming domain-containing fimbrial protein [Paenibacillus sp. CECT 9249]|uniref:isopeptide-forming domain-containing fimbrial protein n=1 Tax=Paenibacillus sp. CECT 9249 TaxID=2845385 RepID=UPI001E3B81D6|nr:isopeptide-forming domain-containing fimbrial protein [Paenibacillus sp. CECT 9249]